MLTTRLRRLGALLAAALCLAARSPVQAQGTATLPPSDLAYADIDRLSELGFLDSVVIGQRPYSRREIGRILRGARERFNQLGEGGAKRRITDRGTGAWRRRAAAARSTLLARAGRVPRQLSGARSIRRRTASSVAYTDAERRPFVGAFGSTLEATIGSLLPRRLGTPLVPGTTGALELSQRLEPTRWLAFAARERADYAWAKDTTLAPRQRRDPSRHHARARTATWRSRSDGRSSRGRSRRTKGCSSPPTRRRWIRSPSSSDRPFVMPGVLRWLGSTKATLVVADLGPSTVRSYSKLLAYKVSIQPSNNAEFGATFLNHYGGRGRPPVEHRQSADRLPAVRRHLPAPQLHRLDAHARRGLRQAARRRRPTAHRRAARRTRSRARS